MWTFLLGWSGDHGAVAGVEAAVEFLSYISCGKISCALQYVVYRAHLPRPLISPEVTKFVFSLLNCMLISASSLRP